VGTRRRIAVRLASSVGVAAFIALAACGSSDSVSDQKIIDKLSLVRSEQTPGYNVAADPFCAVDLNLLNDQSEIDDAQGGSGKGLVITNADGDVGVQAVPPFGPDCVKKTRRGLNAIH
jgi:hypothetical protein